MTRTTNDPSGDAGGPANVTAVRLDVWLDVACLFKTRSEAQQACRTGKIEVNGDAAKPHRVLKTGERIVINRPFGRKQTLVVRGLADRHIARADAHALYEDQTPKPTPEEIEMRRSERIYRAAVTPPRAPDKRERRARRKMKEGEEPSAGTYLMYRLANAGGGGALRWIVRTTGFHGRPRETLRVAFRDQSSGGLTVPRIT